MPNSIVYGFFPTKSVTVDNGVIKTESSDQHQEQQQSIAQSNLSPSSQAAAKKNAGRGNNKMQKKRRAQKYRTAWERLPEFRKWLRPVENDMYKAACIACNKTMVSEVMVLRKHTVAKRHMVKLAEWHRLKIRELMRRSGASSDSDDDEDEEDVAFNHQRDEEIIDEDDADEIEYDDFLLRTDDDRVAHVDLDDEDDRVSETGTLQQFRGRSAVNKKQNPAPVATTEKYWQQQLMEDSIDQKDNRNKRNDLDSRLTPEKNEQQETGLLSSDYKIVRVTNKGGVKVCGFRHIKPVEISSPAPFWKGHAVINGQVKKIKLPDFRGQYLLLFFYTQNFSIACSNDINRLNEKAEQFKVLNANIVACSVDSHYSHLAWCNMDKESGGIGGNLLQIYLLADPTHSIAKKYGCFVPEEGLSRKACFIIDAAGMVRHICVTDNLIAHNFNELLGYITTLQYSDSATSANNVLVSDRNNSNSPIQWNDDVDVVNI